jgi:hypothetical protein
VCGSSAAVGQVFCGEFYSIDTSQYLQSSLRARVGERLEIPGRGTQGTCVEFNPSFNTLLQTN